MTNNVEQLLEKIFHIYKVEELRKRLISVNSLGVKVEEDLISNSNLSTNNGFASNITSFNHQIVPIINSINEHLDELVSDENDILRIGNKPVFQLIYDNDEFLDLSQVGVYFPENMDSETRSKFLDDFMNKRSNINSHPGAYGVVFVENKDSTAAISETQPIDFKRFKKRFIDEIVDFPLTGEMGYQLVDKTKENAPEYDCILKAEVPLVLLYSIQDAMSSSEVKTAYE